MAWTSCKATVVDCVSVITSELRTSAEATFELRGGYPLGWRVYGAPAAVRTLAAAGVQAWVTDGDVVHARRAA